jgi:hypothetical protein
MIVAADQCGRERKRVRLRLRVELRDCFLEVSQSTRIAKRDVGIADLIQSGTHFGRLRLGKRALVAFDRWTNNSACLVDIADLLVERGQVVVAMQCLGRLARLLRNFSASSCAKTRSALCAAPREYASDFLDHRRG